MAIKSHEQLRVWQQSHALTLDIYRDTLQLPDDERFGLRSQMRRAAYSVPSNIAEGFRRRGKNDRAHFYNMAGGSIAELRYFIRLCRDLNYADFASSDEKAESVAKMLYVLETKVRNGS